MESQNQSGPRTETDTVQMKSMRELPNLGEECGAIRNHLRGCFSGWWVRACRSLFAAQSSEVVAHSAFAAKGRAKDLWFVRGVATIHSLFACNGSPISYRRLSSFLFRAKAGSPLDPMKRSDAFGVAEKMIKYRPCDFFGAEAELYCQPTTASRQNQFCENNDAWLFPRIRRCFKQYDNAFLHPAQEETLCSKDTCQSR